LKFTCLNEQEFVIGGYTDPAGRRAAFGALLVGYYHQGKLNYAGKVGTGYDLATLHALGNRLRAAEVGECPFDTCDAEARGVHWVKPTLIAQVAFTEWTRGGKLRHPRFLGLHNDKKPSDVVQAKAG
jgi:ATP-dependent DNA ligase